MSQTIRRLFNSVDRLFDRRAIGEDLRFSRSGGKARQPITAGQAFQVIQPVMQNLDRSARLKRIVSQPGLNPEGASSHWEFFFDLPRRRAQVSCEWVLPWDAALDAHGSARIDTVVKPFPAPDSPIRQLVNNGELLHRQLYGLWEQERSRKPDLPFQFQDSDTALADFIQQGLDIGQDEFSLSTGFSSEGRACWIAQTRRKQYFAPFSGR